MALSTKFIGWAAALLALIAILGGVSVWYLIAMRRSAIVTAAEYDAQDRAEALTVQVAWLRDTLRQANGATYRDAQYFLPLQKEVQQIDRQMRVAAALDDGDGPAESGLGRDVASRLDAAMQHAAADPVARAPGTSKDMGAIAAADALEQLHQSLKAVSRLLPDAARHHALAARDRWTSRLYWMCVWLLLVLCASVAIHVKQYRLLVRPLLWLRDEMRRSAANDFKATVAPRGEREFKEVAALFNGLARELAGLYRDLEAKVIAKSRELVRSERLASVGFLAAGVAHEINNPLGVISGFAELAAMRLRRVMLGEETDGQDAEAGTEAEVEAESLAKALEAQRVIRDEAFRCKEITSRLLSLARGGGDGREKLSLDSVARQVTVLTQGLKNYRDRKVVLDFGPAEPLEVVANPTEMKQVLMNLTVNALEAAPPAVGEVRIRGRRTGEWVELSVEDNGKGMSSETLQQVFEPFFTDKCGAGEAGTGLGLSITHAIIENHGGRIRAESAGPGRGSRFTFRLPAVIRKAGGIHAIAVPA